MPIRTLKSNFSVRTVCPWCNTVSYVYLEEEPYRRWKRGQDTIQKLLPDLHIDEREKLISGTCADCWDRITKTEED